MALSNIVDISEIMAFLGLGTSPTEGQLGLVTLIHGPTENSVRRHLNYDVVANTYAGELHPRVDSVPDRDRLVDSIGGRAVIVSRARSRNNVILLRNIPVLNDSNLEVREDRAAFAGQASGAFATATILTKGVDYYLDVTDADNDLSVTGKIVRVGSGWPAEKGTVKVAYRAGYTADQLGAAETDTNKLDVSAIKLGTLEAIQDVFNQATSRQSTSGGSGAIKSERLGNYSVTYDLESIRGTTGLSSRVRKRLQPFKRYRV